MPARGERRGVNRMPLIVSLASVDAPANLISLSTTLHARCLCETRDTDNRTLCRFNLNCRSGWIPFGAYASPLRSPFRAHTCLFRCRCKEDPIGGFQTVAGSFSSNPKAPYRRERECQTFVRMRCMSSQNKASQAFTRDLVLPGLQTVLNNRFQGMNRAFLRHVKLQLLVFIHKRTKRRCLRFLLCCVEGKCGIKRKIVPFFVQKFYV